MLSSILSNNLLSLLIYYMTVERHKYRNTNYYDAVKWIKVELMAQKWRDSKGKIAHSYAVDSWYDFLFALIIRHL